MARFDVYARRGTDTPPLLLSVQSDFHAKLRTCVMVPLIPLKLAESEKMMRLMPPLDVLGEKYIMSTPELAAVPVSHIGKKICSLADNHYTITSALDFLLEGF